jgi:hypothetical protein
MKTPHNRMQAYTCALLRLVTCILNSTSGIIRDSCIIRLHNGDLRRFSRQSLTVMAVFAIEVTNFRIIS